MQEKNKTIKVVELFAGVGGFRLGLEGFDKKSSTSGYKEKYESPYEVVWSNQYEPSTKTQHASDVYVNRFREEKHSNKDIEKVIEEEFSSIPPHDLLVGGFPCQDYSVATTLKNSKGLIGKKGVLWWSIYRILRNTKNPPKYLFLENVDRLLVSPSNQRGKDFAIILSCLNELGYAAEWRVINAADYGMPQKRRRVYIVAYHKDSKVYESITKHEEENIVLKHGIIAKSFAVNKTSEKFTGKIDKDKEFITENFGKDNKKSPFLNSGFMNKGSFFTSKTSPKYTGSFQLLENIILPINEVDKSFYISKDEPLLNPIEKQQIDGSIKSIKTQIEKWEYLKGSKKEIKINKAKGYEYKYAEGKMVFPDSLQNASRTIITGEGGKSPSRFKHVVETEGRLRRLTPVELERLNMFPDNHTKLNGVTDAKRAFFMGNALVVGVIEKIGKELCQEIKNG